MYNFKEREPGSGNASWGTKTRCTTHVMFVQIRQRWAVFGELESRRGARAFRYSRCCGCGTDFTRYKGGIDPYIRSELWDTVNNIQHYMYLGELNSTCR